MFNLITEQPFTKSIIFFSFALFLAYVINRIFLKFSSNLGVRDHEENNMIRWTADVKPAVGGISFFILFLISVLAYVMTVDLPSTEIFSSELIGLIAATSLGFLIGLADDAYDTNPILKFLGQFACANILFVMGISIEVTSYWFVNYAITVMWVVGIMNSINMLDNMDGITGTISASIIMSCLLVIYFLDDINSVYSLILIGSFAAMLGFLIYNWHPAKMYMGDSGSQFLGAFLAAISMMYLWKFRDPGAPGEFQFRQFVIPLLAFMLPIIDTTTVFVRRIARSQSPFVGGKDHTTHHLAFAGLKDNYVGLVFLDYHLFLSCW